MTIPSDRYVEGYRAGLYCTRCWTEAASSAGRDEDGKAVSMTAHCWRCGATETVHPPVCPSEAVDDE